MDADSVLFRKLYVYIMAVCNTKSHSDVLSRGRSRNFKRGVHRAEFSSKGGGGGGGGQSHTRGNLHRNKQILLKGGGGGADPLDTPLDLPLSSTL